MQAAAEQADTESVLDYQGEEEEETVAHSSTADRYSGSSEEDKSPLEKFTLRKNDMRVYHGGSGTKTGARCSCSPSI